MRLEHLIARRDRVGISADRLAAVVAPYANQLCPSPDDIAVVEAFARRLHNLFSRPVTAGWRMPRWPALLLRMTKRAALKLVEA